MILLSVRAGLRAKEIALATWGMITDAEGRLGDALHLPNKASKGRNGGRTIPLHKELRAALVALKATRNVDAKDRIIHSERDLGMSPIAVQVWFHRHYQSLGFTGASSHSGRRTSVTKLAQKIVEAGGSLRDVQELAATHPCRRPSATFRATPTPNAAPLPCCDRKYRISASP